jgi:hypothetical protein
MTLLDPHPANEGTDSLNGLVYGPNASASTTFILDAYLNVEDELNDPPVRIPSGVTCVEDYWEQDSYSQCPPGDESVLNLWGVSPNYITLDSPSTIFYEKQLMATDVDPLTQVAGIGHSEVHDYYQGILDGIIAPPSFPPPGGGGGGGAAALGSSIPPVLSGLSGGAYELPSSSGPTEVKPASASSRTHVDEYFLMSQTWAKNSGGGTRHVSPGEHVSALASVLRRGDATLFSDQAELEEPLPFQVG